MNDSPVNTAPNTLTGIEFFRGVAAIMVAIYHISRHFEKNFGTFPFSKITEFGHSGVDFFFTLSGFIIYYVHKKDIHNKDMLYPYFAKRFARVYPFYWVMIFLTLCLVPFVSSSSFPLPLDFIKNIVLWPQGMENLIVGVSWTLQHEILFYLLFSVMILHKTAGLILMMSWLLLLMISNFITPLTTNMDVFLSAFNLQFFMGILSAIILIKYRIKYGGIILALGTVCFLGTATLELQGFIDGHQKYARIFYGVSSMLLIIGVVSYEKNGKLRISSIGMLFGKSSYSIYLTHLFFNGIYFKILSDIGMIAALPTIISASLILSLVIASACCLHLYVEQPIIKKTRTVLLQ